jgi:hypothetical protein
MTVAKRSAEIRTRRIHDSPDAQDDARDHLMGDHDHHAA